jgi:hypothetical protein
LVQYDVLRFSVYQPRFGAASAEPCLLTSGGQQWDHRKPTHCPACHGCGQSGGELILGLNTATPINDPVALSGGTPIRMIMKSSFQTPTNIGRTLFNAFVDTGSPAIIFPSSMLPVCATPLSIYYCPATSMTQLATFDPSGANLTVAFRVPNATMLSASGNNAFPDLGGMLSSGTFVWGLPFFYGRVVYIVYGPVTGSVTWNPPMWAYSGSSLPPPSITNVTPAQAGGGATVAIRGLYFGATLGAVSFGGRTEMPTTWSD